jgi:hypothetical protein
MNRGFLGIVLGIKDIIVQTILQFAYPVGTIYTEMTGVNPSITFGFGTWIPFGGGLVLIGVGQYTDSASNTENVTPGVIFGEYRHLLLSTESGTPGVDTGTELSTHTHAVNINSGVESADHAHGTSDGYDFIETNGGGGQTPGGPYGGAQPYTGGQTATHYHNTNGASATEGATHEHAIAAANASTEHNNIQPSASVYFWYRSA